MPSLILGKLPSSYVLFPLTCQVEQRNLAPQRLKNLKIPRRSQNELNTDKGLHAGISHTIFQEGSLECLWNANTPAKLNIGSGLNARDFSQDLSKHGDELMRLCPRHTGMANVCVGPLSSPAPTVNDLWCNQRRSHLIQLSASTGIS